jgi:PAS domain S-box-containing protein
MRASIADRLRGFSRASACLLIALGVVVLSGWLLGLDMLRQPTAAFGTMKPNTALLFVLLGAAMLRVRRAPDVAGCALASVVSLLGAATLLEHAAGIDLGIDAALLRGAPGVDVRMTPFTAIGFVVLGIGAALLNIDRALQWAHAAGYFVLGGAFLALCSLMFGVDEMFGNAAAYAVTGGVVASLTVLTARPDIGLMAILSSDTGAGALLRRLTPAIVSCPVVFAHVGLRAESGGLYDTRFGDALLVTATVAILFHATALIARMLHRHELARSHVQDCLLARERDLAESEYKYRDLYENAPDMLASVRLADGVVQDCNQTLLDALGCAREAVVNRPVFDLCAASFHPALRLAHDQLARSGAISEVELALRRSNGSHLAVMMSASGVRDERGSVIAGRVVWHDISRRRALQELRERERFFELSVDMVSISNAGGYFLQLSPSFCATLGYTMTELLARPYIELVHDDDREATLAVARRVEGGERLLSFTNRFRCRDGAYRWFQWRAQPDEDGVVYSIARDITDDMQAAQELRRSEESLRASLREREVLLQEVHHRVKNNLQIVSSLIGMQLRQPGGTHGREPLLECQGRIQTIALIHEKLYQSDDYARVPFSDYAAGLVANIFEVCGDRTRPVALQVETDRISLPVDRAIPCGLILNELVSNSLRHAFRGRSAGTVRIDLRREGSGIMLAVSDDGVGLAAGFDVRNSSTLGMQLVTALVEQLKGRLEVEQGPGTTFRVRFQGEAA